MRMDSHKVRYMIVLLVTTIVSKVFVNTEPGIYFSLDGQVVPLALWTGPSFKSFGSFFRKKVWLLIIVPESLLSQT